MLSLATVRRRWVSFVGTFVTLALGVALIASTLLVYLAAEPAVPERFAGTPVYVQRTGTPWSPETVRDLSARLAAVPGVTGVVADHSFYAQLVLDGHPHGRPNVRDPQGHAWSTAGLAPYPVTGRPPMSAGEIVVGGAAGLNPGATVTVLTATGPAPYTVTGTIDGPGLYVADEVAARLSGGTRLLGVRGTGAPAAITAVVGDAGTVLSGAGRADLEDYGVSSTRQIGAQVLTGMVLLSAFSTVFVVASTFAFAANQRRREFGLLRAIGATPRQIRRSVAGEALGVGALAGAVGAALGALAAPALGSVLVDVGFEPPGFVTRVPLWPVAVAYLVGLLVAVLGASSAARRAGAVGPVEALREAAVDTRPMTRARWICGGLCAVLGIVLAVVTVGARDEDMMITSMLAAMALMVAMTLLAPVVIPPVVRLVTWPLGRLAGATGILAREGSLTAVRRTASIAAPVIVTVGFAALILGQVATVSAAYRSRGTSAVAHGAVVRPDGTPGLTDAVLAALPAGALAYTSTDVYSGGHSLLAGGVDPATFRPEVRSGSLADFGRPDTVIVAGDPRRLRESGSGGAPAPGAPASDPVARPSVAVGALLPVTFADGRTATLRVVAVIAPIEEAELLLPRATVRAHDPAALTQLAYVDGVPLPDLRAAVAGLGATAVAGGDYESDSSARDDVLVRIFVLTLIGLSVGYTGIAVANTLVMATAGRRRDFAVLRLSGGTVGQVLRVVATEALMVVGIGAALGLGVAVAALVGVRTGLAQALGAPVALLIPWGSVGAIVGACLLLALAASVLPAGLALRRRAVGVTGDRE
ncbi:ABC transporter permease [Longispora sp. K20-0274]|uniref:FtsX-like permease family protein n=1 Tax=Longispora sp. K20-0274 TaxID=3088255 RepID=UPI00399B6988